ncbi:MAG: hypothetical protein GXP11_05730 [Gammaproteobacteria bacterium]|nr:hypothetical protein [Gammaproteobacteria bacterium]
MPRFAGQPVGEQQASRPVAAPVPRFGGEAVDAPDWTDKAAQFGEETLKTVKKGVVDPVKGALIGAANDFSDWVTGKNTEDYPEIPAVTSLSGDFQAADTPVGMMNIVKKQPQYKDKKLDLDQDKYGNPLLLIDGSPHYFNKAGPSLNDYDYLIKGAQSIMPLIVGGAAGASAKMTADVAITGASGFIGEALDQFKSEQAGSEEGYDLKKMRNMGAYAAGGQATGRLIVKVLGGVFGKLFGKKTDINQYFDGTKFTDEGIDLLKKNEVSPETLSRMMTDEMKKTGALTAEQAKRYNKFMDQGINPTKAQITQNADDFRFQQQSIKSEAGRGMRTDLDVQNAQMLSNVDELASKAGGNTLHQAETGNTLVEHITNKALAADARVAEKYREVRSLTPQDKSVSLDNLVDTIRRNMGYNTMSKGAASAVWKDMKMRGILDGQGKLVGRVSVDTAEELRKVMNMTFGEGNPTAKRLMTQFKKSLDDDVYRAAGKDYYKAARAEKIAFHDEFTDAGGHKLQAKAKNVLEKLYNGEITPDKAYVRIVKNGPVKDLQQVKLALHTGTPQEVQAGKQVWDNMRSQVIRDATDMATGGGRNEMGDVVFSMKPFAKMIRHYENTGKLRTLFSDSEITDIKKLIDVGELRIPIVGTGIGEGPSSSAIQKATQSILSRFSWMPGVKMVQGGYAKGMQFADEAAQKSAVEAARQPTMGTVDAIIKGATDINRARSIPARVGGIGGLMMLGEQANSQPQRTGPQR